VSAQSNHHSPSDVDCSAGSFLPELPGPDDRRSINGSELIASVDVGPLKGGDFGRVRHSESDGYFVAAVIENVAAVGFNGAAVIANLFELTKVVG